jgi:hypothetical protein
MQPYKPEHAEQAIEYVNSGHVSTCAHSRVYAGGCTTAIMQSLFPPCAGSYSTHIHTHTCTHTHAHTRTHTRARTYTHTHMHTCTRVREGVRVFRNTSRYVGYFSQRFAAVPGHLQFSRVVVPNTQVALLLACPSLEPRNPKPICDTSTESPSPAPTPHFPSFLSYSYHLYLCWAVLGWREDQLRMSKIRLVVCRMVQGSSGGNTAIEEVSLVPSLFT